ncbi:type I-E CRISPR-associated protein Cas5/CasD [Phreatobacter stygius]|uniref:Type I-E CRISPR-associated protein Cas5/CasD n=1 Tax=Phreatobacter stygius TaxID=1940610 RepID=A0A4D7B216_9HYPH|nr:type I-E CRISPR-associated protein Cas5/CasD [Phreatobacter stygius]QCI66841.1 type I-E CRISPR-associated protein Cas5/CasD [Phreatobacter stygius]
MSERDFLVFRLAGPMAAFGDIAVGERRGIWDAPSKSAILGLVAGALGLKRDDTAAHLALETGLGFAVRVDVAGRPLRDYHTAQAPSARRNGQWRTRQEELADGDELNTVLSERIYRLEAAATVALWNKGSETPSLDALAEALKQPRFTPYIGRKACPLGRPPRPHIVVASGLQPAFAAYDALEADADAKLRFPWFATRQVERQRIIWFEWDAGLADEERQAAEGGRIRQRRDAVRDRGRWQFSDRREGSLTFAPPPAGEAAA